jgi:hypothetical protein
MSRGGREEVVGVTPYSLRLLYKLILILLNNIFLTMLVFNCVRTTLKQKFTWYVFILEQRQRIIQVKNNLDIYQSLLT